MIQVPVSFDMVGKRGEMVDRSMLDAALNYKYDTYESSLYLFRPDIASLF